MESNNTWNTVSIFVSSTFSDMQAERDYLKKVVIPHLNEELVKDKIIVQAIDLRGTMSALNQKEEERESKILKVCIDTIKENRPFFVGIIGDRYGWIPPKETWNKIYDNLSEDEKKMFDNTEPVSVTEIEIIFGAIGKKEFNPRSLFYFRSMSSLDSISDNIASDYIDSPTENSDNSTKKELLRSLKDKIIKTFNSKYSDEYVKTYNFDWNNQKESLQNWSSIIYQDLLREIREELSPKINIHETWETEELNALNNFIASRIQFFYGREDIVSGITHILYNGISPSDTILGYQGIFLSGFSGSGKSSVFSKVYKNLEQISKYEKLVVLAHSAGITSSSYSIENALIRWTYEINKILGVTQIINEDQREYIVDYFYQSIYKLKLKGYNIIVMIDSLDSFESSKIIDKFEFIPRFVPFLVTTLPEHADNIVNSNSHFLLKDIDILKKEEAEGIINGLIKKDKKDVSKNIIECLLNIRNNDIFAYTSPLWLRLAISIFLELDASDFKKIKEREEKHDDEKIEAYILNMAKNFPPEADRLFLQLVNTAGSYFDQIITNKSFEIIALQQNGASEKDLSEQIGKDWDPLTFAQIRRWFRSYLSNDNPQKLWRFTHNLLVKAIREINEEKEIKIKDYFLSKDSYEDEHSRDEVIYQIICNNDSESLYKFLEYDWTFKRIENLLTSNESQHTLKILDKLFRLYYREWKIFNLVRLLSVRLIDSFKRQNSLPAKAHSIIKNLNISYLNCFHTQNIKDENEETIEFYFSMVNNYMEYLQQIDDIGEITELFRKIIDLYEENFAPYNTENIKFMRTTNFNDFFSGWGKYCVALSKYENTYENALKEGHKLLNRLVEYKTINIDDLRNNDDPFLYFSLWRDIQDKKYKRSLFETMHDYLYRHLELYEKTGNENLSGIVDITKEYINHYINIFEWSTDLFTETNLIKYIQTKDWHIGHFKHERLEMVMSGSNRNTFYDESEYSYTDEDSPSFTITRFDNNDDDDDGYIEFEISEDMTPEEISKIKEKLLDMINKNKTEKNGE